MERRWLVLGLLAATWAPAPARGTEMCLYNPPEVRYATFKALEYKNGTMLNCDCKTGFRRVNRLSYMTCLGNSSWNDECRCVSLSKASTGRQVSAAREDPHREPAAAQKAAPPEARAPPPELSSPLPGQCREPPPWDHEGSERTYHFVLGQTVHYQCLPGYRALRRGPATSLCKMIRGSTTWTQPQLRCTDERRHPGPPGEEEAAASPDPPAESATPRAVTTTDPQPRTEAASPAQTFLLAVEHQVAVAGCVFLLIGILLLSGLTWQWRRAKRRRPT
uniref:interleukin-2 receptor subunit alpha n=1 Tax=Jaculus jaculus TaxID=51337 RepID=UPI001E1B553D|nr:interleukin-2 receptor subunit alpha [Jaculus jaculus]